MDTTYKTKILRAQVMNEDVRNRLELSTSAKAYVLKGKGEVYTKSKNKLISRLIDDKTFFTSQFKYELYSLVGEMNSTLLQFSRVYGALIKGYWIQHAEALNICLTIAMTKTSIKRVEQSFLNLLTDIYLMTCKSEIRYLFDSLYICLDSLIDLFKGFKQPEIIGVVWTEDEEDMQLSLKNIPIKALYPENAEWMG